MVWRHVFVWVSVVRTCSFFVADVSVLGVNICSSISPRYFLLFFLRIISAILEFLHVFEFHVNANAALFKLDEHVSEDYVGYDSIYQQTMNELELTR